MHAHARAQQDWRGAEVQSSVKTDADFQALKARGLVEGPFDNDRRRYARKSWQAERALERAYPGFGKKKERAAHLRALRTELLGAEKVEAMLDDAFATPWLNGPFELSAAAKKEVAKEEARRANSDRQAETDRLAREELQARQADAVARLEAEAADPNLAWNRDARFTEVLELLNGPAPWRKANSHYELAISANGARIGLNSFLARRLAVLALNIIAGVEPAQLFGAAEPKPERSTFEALAESQEGNR